MCTLNEILFDVELIENPVRTNSEYSRIVRGWTNENGVQVVKDLNYCSPRYELVENAMIFPNIENVLKMNGIEFTAKYRHIDHVRFYADYVITDGRYKYDIKGKNDIVMPKLTVQHSYNGLTKYAINFGYFRLICTNGLVIPVKDMNMFNLSIQGKHTSSIIHSIERLNDMLTNFTTNASTIIGSINQKFEQLCGVIVNKPEDRIIEVMNANGLSVIDNNKFNTVNDIMLRINKEVNDPTMGYGGVVNDWLIYNGINQYINDTDRTIEVPEKRMEKDSKVLEYMLAS